MIYNGFALDNDMRVTQCPKCNNEEVGGNYCKICSTYLFNKCTGIDPNDNNDYYNQNIKWGQYQGGCDILLEGNARICHECGSTSSFFEDRLLRYWNETDDNGELVNQEGQYEDVPLPF